MAHPRMALIPLMSMLLCLSPLCLSAQATSAENDLKEGIDLFRNGQYDKAILLFHNVLLDPSADAQKPQTYLLIAKAYMAIDRLDEATRNLEFFLANYPDAPEYPEALYQEGRLLYLQEDFESAVQVLQSFIARFPKSTFAPSAWFWAGESLYGLGRLEDATLIYRKIVSDYPTSVKFEAAQYKVSLITLRQKEVELQRLLKWSHEDALKSIEEFQIRERSYQQAIEAYQKRLAASTSGEDQKTIAELRRELAAKTEEASKLAKQLEALGASASAAPGAGEADRLARLQRLLAAQEAALALKEKYLSQIDAGSGGDK